MIPELFRIGSFAISPFGVMLMVAFVGSFFQLRWGLRKLGAGDEDDASALLLWSGLVGIAGGKIYYAVLYGDPALLLDRAGIVWYGGFLGGLTAFLVILRLRRLRPWPTLDAAGPALAVGYGLGRIGCFLVGDDYGVPSDLPWAVEFRQGVPPTTVESLRQNFGIEVAGGPGDFVAVHPTQLYETLIAFAIWGVGVWLLKRRPQPNGQVFAITIGLLSIERFAVEFLRAKDDRLLGGFTIAQAIAVAVLITMVGVFFARRRGRSAGGG